MAIATLSLPDRAFRGIEAIVKLGKECIRGLATSQAREPLTLSLSKLFADLARKLNCEEAALETAVMSALVPLNTLRRDLGAQPSDFTDALKRAVLENAPDSWLKENREKWNEIVDDLRPFFEPDEFFSQLSKAFDLITERPALLQSVRVLSELRPIFNESQTAPIAMLQANSLILTYWDGNESRTLHITIDSDDIGELEKELQRAKEKILVLQQRVGINVVVSGQSATLSERTK
jgi:hypothetical protein